MNEELLEKKIIEYISTVMIPKMPTGINKFLGYIGIGAISNNMSEILAPYTDMAKKVCIIDEAGMVDLQKLQFALNYAFDKVPSVSVMGFTFTKADVPSFMSFLVA